MRLRQQQTELRKTQDLSRHRTWRHSSSRPRSALRSTDRYRCACPRTRRAGSRSSRTAASGARPASPIRVRARSTALDSDRRAGNRRRARRRRDRQRRHRPHAVRRRRLGVARRGARWRSRVSREPAAEAEYPDNRSLDAAGGSVGSAHRRRGDRQRRRAGANEARRRRGGGVLPLTSIPLDELPALDIVESFAPRDIPYIAANGIQARMSRSIPSLAPSACSISGWSRIAAA